MKKVFIFLIVLLSCFSIYSQDYFRKYSLSEPWFSSTEACGNSIYELKIKDNQNNGNKNKSEIKVELTHTITPFSQIISAEFYLNLTTDEKYEFSFIDAWNNKAFGWVLFHNEEAELYLDCNQFNDAGKNFARLYGDTVKLQNTTNDRYFFNNAREADFSVKKLLNEKNSNYFPINKENTQLFISYIGIINDIKIYKTNLIWNIHSSKRMTHRLVFIENEKVIGIYGGIQSNKIQIKDDEIIFEDLEKENIIKINEVLPKSVFIDGEIFRLEE